MFSNTLNSQLSDRLNNQSSCILSPQPQPKYRLILGALLLWTNLASSTILLSFLPEIGSERSAIAADTRSLDYNANLWLQQGRTAFEAGLYDTAIEAFSQAIQAQPSSPFGYYNRGFVYFIQNNDIAAIADYSEAIRLDKSYVQAYVNRGNLYSRNGQLSAAINDYQTALSLDPSNVEAHYNLGVSYSELEDWENALESYNQAILVLPENSLQSIPIYLNRTTLNLEQHNLDAAIADSQHILELDPQNAPAHGNLGLAYALMGNLEQAIPYLETAETLF